MDFRLLGPLEVIGGTDPLPLGGTKPRLVLAALLVDAGTLVGAERLIDLVWGERPPPSAANALQVHVSHLRRVLASDDDQPRLVTRGSGYVLTPLPDEVDADRFQALAATGRLQLERGDAEAAAGTLRRALALWRGPVLADLPEATFAEPTAAAMDALRVRAVGDRVDADLATGHHAELVPELDRLVAEHPTDERLLGQQMLALYRTGRQGDALAAYRAGRVRLAEELGIDPDRRLRDLERRILDQDRGLDLTAPAVAVDAPPRRERRMVSVLAVDLAALAAMPDDPETAAERLAEQRALTREHMVAAGGAGVRSVGLIEVAVFGVPTAYGDDAARALACATSLAPTAAAVATGLAVADIGGDAEQPSGEEVLDRAIRLLVSHRVGVVADVATRDAARHRIAFVPVPGGEGTDGIPSAWQVAGSDLDASDRRRAPMVGRGPDLDVVRAAWQRAHDARIPQVVTVTGVPGIGKSRLADELAASAQLKGARVLVGRALPQGEQGTYVPFGQQVATLAGIRPEDSAAQAVQRLREVALDLGVPDHEVVVDHVALLIGLRRDEAVADRQPLFYAARLLVEAVATERPTLLVLDDLHWADDSTLDLVEQLAARIRDVPLLVLVLARPELLDRRPGWGGGAGERVSVLLHPLGEQDSAEMAGRLLGPEAASDLALQVARRAEGNPLFVEELVAASVEGGRVEDLPATMRTAITARLDALPPRSRALLLDVAVMGRRFWPAAAGTMRGLDATELAAALEDLDRRDLVRRDDLRQLPGQDQYIFKHALIREAAYDLLPTAERRDRHAAVAAFVERSAGSRAVEHAALLAYHWKEAGSTDEARRWFVRAADQARRGWAKSEAITALDEALALVDPGGAEDLRIRLARGLALMENGQYADAATELDDVLPRLEGDDLVLAMLARTKAAWWLEDAQGVRALAARVQSLAGELGRPEQSAPALALLSHVSGMEGRPRELIEQGRRALDAWQPDRLVADRAYHMELVGLAQTWVGDYAPAGQLLTQSYEAAESCHSVEAMIRAGASVGLALAGLGRHEEALARLQGVVARGRELELVPRFTGRALNMMSMVLREILDLDAAERCNHEAAELGRQAAFLLVQVQAGIDLLFTDLLRDDPSAAQERLPALWQQTEQAHGFHQWLMAGRLLVAEAEIAVASKQWQRALDYADRAREAAVSTGRRKHEIAAVRARATALSALGDPAGAAVAADSALVMAVGTGHPPTTWRTAALVSPVFDAASRPADAVTAATLAGTTAGAFAATLTDDHRARFVSHPEVAALLTR